MVLEAVCAIASAMLHAQQRGWSRTRFIANKNTRRSSRKRVHAWMTLVAARAGLSSPMRDSLSTIFVA